MSTQYIQFPFYVTNIMTLDIELDDLSDNCYEPRIIEGHVEGSSMVVVVAGGMPDKTVIELSTGDLGIIYNGFALVELKYPLRKGQVINAFFNTPKCKVSGCGVEVMGLVSNPEACRPRTDLPPSGTLTGVLLCEGKQLYRQIHNGNGGFAKGEVVYEDCIWCGGVEPNCEE